MLTKEMIQFVKTSPIIGGEKNFCDTFRKLHFEYGFDFNKPYNHAVIKGKFTLNMARKAVNWSYSDRAVILLYGENMNRDRLFCVEITGADVNSFSIEPDREKRAYMPFQTTYDTFCRKNDFNDARKNSTRALVIAQSTEYICRPKRKTTADILSYPFSRVRLTGAIIRGTNRDGTVNYVSQVDFIPVYSHGEKYTWEAHGQIFYSSDIKTFPKNVNEIFDRSGYYIRDRRENLKRAAAARRAENEKNVFIGSDYSAELAELETLKTKALETMKTKAAAAADHKTLLELSRKIERFSGGLAWIIRDHELFVDRITGKKYSSCTKAETAFKDVKSKYEKFIAKWTF